MTPSFPRIGVSGHTGAVHFVVWLPTWRQNTGHHSFPSPPETTDVHADDALARCFAPGASALGDLGIQVIVKPHPLDRVSRSLPGALLISEEALQQAGTSLYCLLGGSAGLITDYSSVWTDYLVLDRPIAFYMPDLDAYTSVRRMYPREWVHHLPGRRLIDINDFTAFGRETSGDVEDSGRPLRQHAREYFELIHPAEPAENLLHELEQRGVLKLADEPEPSAARQIRADQI